MKMENFLNEIYYENFWNFNKNKKLYTKGKKIGKMQKKKLYIYVKVIQQQFEGKYTKKILL